MKKFLVACTLLLSVCTFSANAQQWGGQGGDTTGRAQRMKEYREKQKAGLIEKAGLTSDEADKVLDIQAGSMSGMRGMRDLSEDERKKKREEMEADVEKKYKASPLTDEKIKAVKDYMQSQMRNRGQRGQNPAPAAPVQQ